MLFKRLWLLSQPKSLLEFPGRGSRQIRGLTRPSVSLSLGGSFLLSVHGQLDAIHEHGSGIVVTGL